MSAPIDITGQRYGRLVAVKRSGPNGLWLWQCDCGSQPELPASNVKNGNTGSCGCLRRELFDEKHTKRRKRLPEYTAWKAMRQRCNDPNAHNYSYYGGRGIGICSRWDDFEAFLADMGSKPSPKHSLDRIESDKDYSPENCRWATQYQQVTNVRRNIWITIDGVTKTICAWADHFGISRATVARRRNDGWPESEWFKPPAKKAA